MILDRTTQNEDDVGGSTNPTEAVHSGFYQAFKFFNAELFGGALPDALIDLQRRARSRGHFAGERFGHRRRGDKVDEIALNPQTFIDRTDQEIISTLVHEMVHLWQFHFGKPGRRGYHNKQWAAKMEALGLMPSHTGEPGGKKTGQRVTHYIIPNGPYDTKWKALASSGYTLDYQDRLVGRPPEPRKMKVRYACPRCSIHVWGKPDIRVACIDCTETMR